MLLLFFAFLRRNILLEVFKNQQMLMWGFCGKLHCPSGFYGTFVGLFYRQTAGPQVFGIIRGSISFFGNFLLRAIPVSFGSSRDLYCSIACIAVGRHPRHFEVSLATKSSQISSYFSPSRIFEAIPGPLGH